MAVVGVSSLLSTLSFSSIYHARSLTHVHDCPRTKIVDHTQAEARQVAQISQMVTREIQVSVCAQSTR